MIDDADDLDDEAPAPRGRNEKDPPRKPKAIAAMAVAMMESARELIERNAFWTAEKAHRYSPGWALLHVNMLNGKGSAAAKRYKSVRLAFTLIRKAGFDPYYPCSRLEGVRVLSLALELAP